MLLTFLGLPEALDESHGLALEPTQHPAPSARVHQLRELLQHHRDQQQQGKQVRIGGPASTYTKVFCGHGRHVTEGDQQLKSCNTTPSN